MLLFNLVGFNLIWFALIYWGNIVIPAAVSFLAIHIYLNRNTATTEILLIFSVASFGILVDSILQYFSVFVFTEQSHLPFWLIMLWLCFATTITQSLAVLNKSKIFQGVVGLFIAPLSYIAGEKLNAVEFGMSMFETYILLSCIWCVLMLTFFYIKDVLKETELNYEEIS